MMLGKKRIEGKDCDINVGIGEIKEMRFESENEARKYAQLHNYNIHSITVESSYHLLRYSEKQRITGVVLVEKNRTGEIKYFSEQNKTNRTKKLERAKIFKSEYEALSYIGYDKGWFPKEVDVWV